MATDNFQGVKCSDHLEDTGRGVTVYGHDSESSVVCENWHHVMLMFSETAFPKVSFSYRKQLEGPSASLWVVYTLYYVSWLAHGLERID